MKRFKEMAFAKVDRSNPDSILGYVGRQKTLLQNFFRSKKWFDYYLLPINAALGVIILFNIFVPEGVIANINGVIITYLVTMASCLWEIRSDNKKSFIQPLQVLQQILDEYKN
jgi:hypothetical protein